MSKADNALRLMRARTFLYSRQAALYGARPVLFDLEKGYRDFDAMLKRSVYYARFAVREVMAEARADYAAGIAVLRIHRRAGHTPAQGGPSSFEKLLDSKRLLPVPGGPRKRIHLAGRSHEVDIVLSGPDRLELRLVPHPGIRQPGIRLSACSLQEAWIQSLLGDWVGDGSDLRLIGGPADLARGRASTWTVSRRISQVDVDISGEEIPHVFRWKEITMARSSSFAELDDADIAAVLSASGTAMPLNAHLQGRLHEILDQGSACLLLRFAHRIPDPDPGADGNDSTVPPQLSAGFIVMENDYLEILIDAGTGRVFSEALKWRPEPVATTPEGYPDMTATTAEE